MLGILSVLNWAMAALYGSVGVLVFMLPFPLQAALPMFGVLMVLAAPHAYLGLNVEKGRGRTLQTIFAVLNLLNFPLGTAFGAFALWVCWDVEKERFDFPDEAAGDLAPPPEEENEDTLADAPQDDTPYDLARGLAQRGVKPAVIRQRLETRGLDDDEIETIMNALGLKRVRAPVRVAAARKPTRPPPRRPRE